MEGEGRVQGPVTTRKRGRGAMKSSIPSTKIWRGLERIMRGGEVDQVERIEEDQAKRLSTREQGREKSRSSMVRKSRVGGFFLDLTSLDREVVRGWR